MLHYSTFWYYGIGEGCGGTVVGNDGVFVGKPACSQVWRFSVVWIGLWVLNLFLRAFFSRFSLSLFLKFVWFSIGVILFAIIFFIICLSLIERLESSALLNMFFFVASILASMLLAFGSCAWLLQSPTFSSREATNSRAYTCVYLGLLGSELRTESPCYIALNLLNVDILGWKYAQRRAPAFSVHSSFRS